MVSCVFSIDSIRSLRWVSRKRVPFSRLLVLVQRHHVHRAHLLEPLLQAAAVLVLRGQFLASQPHHLRVVAQHLRLNIHLGQATGLKMFEVRVQLGQLRRFRARVPRATRSRAVRPAFSCVSISASCCRSVCACAATCCASGQRLGPHRRQAPSSASSSSTFSLVRCSRSAMALARCCSIACTRRSRSACSRSMRWNAASAPRRRSSSPASSAVSCAASCCTASRFCRNVSSCACKASNPASACVCSLSSRVISARLISIALRFISHASLLRAA